MSKMIICSNARPSTTDVDMAVDVDVRITFADGLSTHNGSVTLVHNLDNSSARGLVAYGNSPDHWVSGGLLKAIYANSYSDGVWERETLQEIEAAALACAVAAGLA